MIPDPTERTVDIAVRVIGGKVELLYGGPLPELADRTVGRLVVPAMAFRDDEMLQQFTRELSAPFVRKGTTLLAGLRANRTDRHLKSHTDGVKCFHWTGQFAEITLRDDLEILLRGSKRASLRACKCSLPALGNDIAMSLNEAFTKLSIAYETSRRSHTGNVFERIFYFSSGNDEWLPLDLLRQPLEAKIERRVITLLDARSSRRRNSGQAG